MPDQYGRMTISEFLGQPEAREAVGQASSKGSTWLVNEFVRIAKTLPASILPRGSSANGFGQGAYSSISNSLFGSGRGGGAQQIRTGELPDERTARLTGQEAPSNVDPELAGFLSNPSTLDEQIRKFMEFENPDVRRAAIQEAQRRGILNQPNFGPDAQISEQTNIGQITGQDPLGSAADIQDATYPTTPGGSRFDPGDTDPRSGTTYSVNEFSASPGITNTGAPNNQVSTDNQDIDVTQLPGYEEYRQFIGESNYVDNGGVFDPALGRGVQNRKDAEAVFRWARGIAAGVFQDPRTGQWMKDGIPGVATIDEIKLAQERDDWLAQAWQVQTASIESQKAVQDAYNDTIRDRDRERLERKTDQIRFERKAKREDDLARVESRADKLELQARHLREDQAAEDEHERRLEMINQGHVNNLALTDRQNESSLLLLQRQFDIQYEITNLEQQFKSEQSALDRALEAANMDEARRASRALEGLRQQEVDIQERRVALDTFNSISSNPAMLYFAQQTGMLSQLGDIFGDGGDTLQGIMDDINESPANTNIQEFARMSSFDQTIEAFKAGAQTGVSTKDLPGVLRGQSPGGRGILRPVSLNTPIGPGSASGTPYDYLGGPQLPDVGLPDGGAVNPQRVPGVVPNPYGTGFASGQ
jgi:hypothetical protein